MLRSNTLRPPRALPGSLRHPGLFKPVHSGPSQWVTSTLGQTPRMTRELVYVVEPPTCTSRRRRPLAANRSDDVQRMAHQMHIPTDERCGQATHFDQLGFVEPVVPVQCVDALVRCGESKRVEHVREPSRARPSRTNHHENRRIHKRRGGVYLKITQGGIPRVFQSTPTPGFTETGGRDGRRQIQRHT